MKNVLLSSLALLVMAGAAQADVKGTYQLKEGQEMRLFYRSDDQIRMTMGKDTQLLLKGGKTWMLNRQGSQWLAMDMAQMGGLMQAMRRPVAVDSDSTAGASSDVSMEPLGRKETVAGYEGEVYELRDGEDRYEVVLSDHPDVRALTAGWRQLAGKLASSFGVQDAERLQQALNALPDQQTGLLRQGDNLVLTGVETSVAAGEVDFPPGTQKMEMPSLPGLR